jgi:CCR4-NOT transcription complex subunit 2
MKNVPATMLIDQFGMVGLLAYIKADREKENCVLALGSDLTALGLNLNSAEFVILFIYFFGNLCLNISNFISNLYHSFQSPFSDIPCRLQDIGTLKKK